MATIIRKERLETFIRRLGGKIFTIEFVKKNGKIRKMNCRKGVHKGVKGTRRSGTGTWSSSIKVFDMQKGQFRHINLSKAFWMKADGKEFTII